MKRLYNRLNRENGSATVEAIVSFTGFLFVIFTILNVVNFCRAQMLISNAVDTATKEISEYSYFYKMSGLQKFSEEVSANAVDGKTNLNDVIGTVDNLYSSIGTAVDNTADHVTNVQNAVEEGNINLDSIKNTLAGISRDGTNIETAMNSVMSEFDTVQDNPLLYMKSIIAVAGNESLDLLKSHVIAAPLAKSFTTKHFGSTSSEASANLEKLGVVDGLDGLNFKMSTIFSSDEPENVHIVVYYKLKIVQLFGWATLEVPMCKESVACAWLGGDDVQKIIEPMVAAAPDNDGEDGDGDSPSEPDDDSGAGNTGLWALPKRTEDEYYGVQGPAFGDLLGETYGFKANTNTLNLAGQNGANAYGCMNLADGDDVLLGINGERSLIAQNAYLSSIRELKRYEDSYDPEEPKSGFNYKPGDIQNIVYVVYVPENIPDDVLNDIKAKSEVGSEDYKKQARNLIGRDVNVTISFVKAGGTYDYGGEG